MTGRAVQGRADVLTRRLLAAMRTRRLLAAVAALALAGSLLAACSSARIDVGTADESCYQALPTAAKAVGGHGHLAGVRKYTVGSLRELAPHLYHRLADELPKGQAVCLAGYTGHFSAAEVQKPLGRTQGIVAVAVVTWPGDELLGTLILERVPVRFQHSHLF